MDVVVEVGLQLLEGADAPLPVVGGPFSVISGLRDGLWPVTQDLPSEHVDLRRLVEIIEASPPEQLVALGDQVLQVLHDDVSLVGAFAESGDHVGLERAILPPLDL